MLVVESQVSVVVEKMVELVEIGDKTEEVQVLEVVEQQDLQFADHSILYRAAPERIISKEVIDNLCYN
jgi:hypothetical protein